MVRKKTDQHNVLVSGIPGSGKTTYCEWLEQEKGFLHLDFDELLQGRGTEPKLELIRRLSLTAETFLGAVSKLEQPIAIDWGFRIDAITLVRLFKASGFTMWWFDGDRAAAQESFLRRGTVSVEAFRAQMESIEQGWRFIEDVIEGNLIHAVSAGPAHANPEYIYSRMFPR